MDKAPALRSALSRASGRTRPVIGGHVFLADSSITEAMATFGYDFIWIDNEHGAFDRTEILAHIVAANGAGAAAIVRVAANDPALIKPVLEMGPDGIIVPMVCTKAEAERAVAACRYPPAGIRGFGPRRANRYGAVPNAEYLAASDAAILKIVQIEHIEAVRNLAGILSVEGLDAVVIGPNDLSGSVGLLGQVTHPRMVELYAEIIGACRRAGIPCGASIGPADRRFISDWIAWGIDYLSCGDEIGFIKAGAVGTIDFIRNHEAWH